MHRWLLPRACAASAAGAVAAGAQQAAWGLAQPACLCTCRIVASCVWHQGVAAGLGRVPRAHAVPLLLRACCALLLLLVHLHAAHCCPAALPLGA